MKLSAASLMMCLQAGRNGTQKIASLPYVRPFCMIWGTDRFRIPLKKYSTLTMKSLQEQIILGEHRGKCRPYKVSPDFPEKVAEVIEKTSEKKLVVSFISSQIDADRMDYLQRDAYFTGVSYGQFDMERILRVMRPQEDQVVIKKSGMHAVEDYIMSRYQMYWQVYFHPVSRSAEVILTKILHRAKQLSEENYAFKNDPIHFYTLFTDQVTLEDYLKLDEAVIMYYFQIWQEEDDQDFKRPMQTVR